MKLLVTVVVLIGLGIQSRCVEIFIAFAAAIGCFTTTELQNYLKRLTEQNCLSRALCELLMYSNFQSD